MSEKPFERHEALRNSVLAAIKREIVGILADFEIQNITYTAFADGTGFTVTADRVLTPHFMAALQAIALEYDEDGTMIFDVENVTNLTIKVCDTSSDARPTFH